MGKIYCPIKGCRKHLYDIVDQDQLLKHIKIDHNRTYTTEELPTLRRRQKKRWNEDQQRVIASSRLTQTERRQQFQAWADGKTGALPAREKSEEIATLERLVNDANDDSAEKPFRFTNKDVRRHYSDREAGVTGFGRGPVYSQSVRHHQTEANPLSKPISIHDIQRTRDFCHLQQAHRRTQLNSLNRPASEKDLRIARAYMGLPPLQHHQTEASSSTPSTSQRYNQRSQIRLVVTLPGRQIIGQPPKSQERRSQKHRTQEEHRSQEHQPPDDHNLLNGSLDGAQDSPTNGARQPTAVTHQDLPLIHLTADAQTAPTVQMTTVWRGSGSNGHISIRRVQQPVTSTGGQNNGVQNNTVDLTGGEGSSQNPFIQPLNKF